MRGRRSRSASGLPLFALELLVRVGPWTSLGRSTSRLTGPLVGTRLPLAVAGLLCSVLGVVDYASRKAYGDS